MCHCEVLWRSSSFLEAENCHDQLMIILNVSVFILMCLPDVLLALKEQIRPYPASRSGEQMHKHWRIQKYEDLLSCQYSKKAPSLKLDDLVKKRHCCRWELGKECNKASIFEPRWRRFRTSVHWSTPKVHFSMLPTVSCSPDNRSFYQELKENSVFQSSWPNGCKWTKRKNDQSEKSKIHLPQLHPDDLVSTLAEAIPQQACDHSIQSTNVISHNSFWKMFVDR